MGTSKTPIARVIFAAIACGFIVGCPAQPPATQNARTPSQFLTMLSTVIPAGTDVETALNKLKYREGIQAAKEVSFGNFTANEGTATEETHDGIRFIEFERMIATANREWQTIKVAMVIENGKVSHCLTSVIKTEAMPEPKSKRNQ